MELSSTNNADLNNDQNKEVFAFNNCIIHSGAEAHFESTVKRADSLQNSREGIVNYFLCIKTG